MATHSVTPSTRALGLLDHVLLTDTRRSPFLDFVKLVFRVPVPLQPSQIFRHFPKVWRQKKLRVRRVKPTIAAHIPGARRPRKNTCDHFTLTIHEPHSWGFCVADLRRFLDAIPGVQLCPEFHSLEWGVDFWMDGRIRECIDKDPDAKQVYLQLCGDFAACLASRLKRPMGIEASTTRTFIPTTTAQIERMPECKGETEWIDTGGHGFASAIANMQTTYIGNAPEWKDKAGGWHWRDSIQLRAYYKTTDGGTSLPTDQHRLRIEYTASGKHCPVDVLVLLAGNTGAANGLASSFAAEIPLNGLHSVIKQRLGLSHAARAEKVNAVSIALNGKLWTQEKLRNKFKREGRNGHQLPRVAADTPWNQRIVGDFIAMARRMAGAQENASVTPEAAIGSKSECAGFTVIFPIPSEPSANPGESTDTAAPAIPATEGEKSSSAL